MNAALLEALRQEDAAASFRLLDSSKDSFLQCGEVLGIIKSLGLKEEDFLRLFDKYVPLPLCRKR